LDFEKKIEFMYLEIERKFLVKGDYKPYVKQSKAIAQGYLSSDPARTVRVRISDDKAFLTIKGESNSFGVSRFEWEKEISASDARQLLQLCDPAEIINKRRHIIPTGDFIWEVDEFFGVHKGLVIAEIELPSEKTAFAHPDWLGEEVTGNPHYYNAYLSKHPYININTSKNSER
jgi:adenylate cyclase